MEEGGADLAGLEDREAETRGDEFVGNGGGGGFNDFAALADVANVAQGSPAEAGPAKTLMDARTYEAAAVDLARCCPP